MRGSGTEPYIHVTELGESSRGIGFGLLAQSEADLESLAREFNVPVRDNLEPRGGRIVTLTDPDGIQIDVVYGGRELQPLPVRESLKINSIDERRRLGGVQRIAIQPSAVMRLGHAVLKVRDFQTSCDFYTKTFGLTFSDGYYDGDASKLVVGFLRCGLGKRYTDHHTIALVQQPGGGFDHTAFQVIDWDDVAAGHQYLRSKGYFHSWGIGRHVEGSQVFDYWRDPFGNKIEHWTDGDLINEDYVGTRLQISPEAISQWSPPMSPDFMT